MINEKVIRMNFSIDNSNIDDEDIEIFYEEEQTHKATNYRRGKE